MADQASNSYTFTKSSIAAKNVHGFAPIFSPPSNYKEDTNTIKIKSKKRWKKVGYKIIPMLDEVEPPHVILVNRRLQKIGEILNISDFRETLKELNQANEISFTVTKELNNNLEPNYNRIQDLSVVYVNGEFFEIGITNKEDASLQKNVVGVSLGYAELSQIINTIEINTNDDLIRPELDKFRANYDCGTIFYNPVQVGETGDIAEWRKLTSMLDRIMSVAPHYKIGHIDESLRNVKREFSWQDTDIVSILNQIGEEIGCVFDIEVTYDPDGNPLRFVHAYDLCYCKYCWDNVKGGKAEFEQSGDTYRNIQNGVCQHCKDTIDINTGLTRTGSEDIVEIGANTGVFLSTENLTDEITIDGNKDEIKTAFKVEGGDDLITATVQGLNPSGYNRIMIYPDYLMKNFSPELYNNYKTYRDASSVANPSYEELLEHIYNIQDLILYLRHGRMPISDETVTDVDEAFYEISIDIATHFNNIFYIDTEKNLSEYAIKSSVSNLIKTVIPKGFGVSVDVTDGSKKTFYGTITIYNSNRTDSISVTRNSIGVNITVGENKIPYVGEYSSEITAFVNNIKFYFGDVDNVAYAGYIQEYCASLLSKNDLEYDNEQEKPWSKYSYERLKNYYDGYQDCIGALHSLKTSAETAWMENEIDKILSVYNNFCSTINSYLKVIKDQLFALEKYLGEFDDLFVDSNGDLLPYAYSGKIGTTDYDVLSSIVNSSAYSIGNYPCKCLKCGSTNVRRLINNTVNCRNCGNTDTSLIETYRDMAQRSVSFCGGLDSYITTLSNNLGAIIKNPYQVEIELRKNGNGLVNIRKSIREFLDIHKYLDDVLFSELMSYTREQVYSNSNYISDNLTNQELMDKAIELQNKAKKELAKACMPQYSISATVGSIVALEPYEYMGEVYNNDLANFAINNYIHVRMDGDIYKLRIASIELTYPMSDKVSVTFTNAERYVDGMSSDIASIISNAESMATTYNYVATQSEKGLGAYNQFEYIKEQGLDTSLMAINGGHNQDVVIDESGILLRSLNEFTGLYDPHQTKIIHNNIVMTDDNWEHARLAIGLTLNPLWTEGLTTDESLKYLYGVYADAIVGDIILGNRIRRIGNAAGDECTVDINQNGIEITKGLIDISDENGNRAIINPIGKTKLTTDETEKKTSGEVSPNYIFYASVANKGEVFSVNRNGDAYFSGTIYSKKGQIANWTIDTDSLSTGPYGQTGSMYFGIQGLSLGSQFMVSPDGVLTAKAGTIGKLKIDPNGNLITEGDGLFKGNVEATGGRIGCFNIDSDSLWTSSDQDGVNNNIRITQNSISCGAYTLIDNTGLIKTGRLMITSWGNTSQSYNNTNGASSIYFDIKQGTYKSKPFEDYSGPDFYPLQVDIGGADLNGNPVQEAYVGIWQRGRMIIGMEDRRGKAYAYKLAVNGTVYCQNAIYMDGEDGKRHYIKFNEKGEFKTGLVDGDYK